MIREPRGELSIGGRDEREREEQSKEEVSPN